MKIGISLSGNSSKMKHHTNILRQGRNNNDKKKPTYDANWWTLLKEGLKKAPH